MDVGVFHEVQVVLKRPPNSGFDYAMRAHNTHTRTHRMRWRGGGGGGGHPNGCTGVNTPPGNPALATITGSVFDTAGNPVDHAGVTVIVPGGTNLSTTTDCTGKFVVTNVALTATSFMVSSPNVVAYFNYANYHGHLYDLVNCSLPLPKLVAGSNAPYTQIQMYLGGENPPPPPPSGGCPV